MTQTRRVPSSATEELHKLINTRLVLIRTFIKEPILAWTTTGLRGSACC